MKNFTFYNPTKLIFGKGQLEQLKTEAARFGKKYQSYTVAEALSETVYTTK